MSQLFLKFIDENGDEREICVDQDEFVIGRHTENDLTYVNSKLSRQHVKIQRFGDVFVISDAASSNGTTLNGEDLEEPFALKNADIINLGGGLEIEVKSDANAQDDLPEDTSAGENASNAEPSGGDARGKNSLPQTSGGSGINKALILAPILGLFLLISVVGAVILINGVPEKEIAQNDGNDSEFIKTSTPIDADDVSEDDDLTPNNKNTNTPEASSTNNQNLTNPDNVSTPEKIEETTTDTSSIPDESDELGKIRSDSFKFMRKIARSNQRPVLLSKQLAMLEITIKPFRSSSALASNIKNAQNNASAIQELARSKNLKPQFLVTAALAKLGSSKGDVLAKAREMAEPLDNLNIQIGDEQADDNLIIIAAYDQGVSGDTLKMRNTLQRLAGKNPNRASEIRTIWFLKEKNEISDGQFNLALQFLAIGTITQNPEAYNVNAKALNL